MLKPKELVLLGGGHSHVEVLRVFGNQRRLSRREPRQPHQQHGPSSQLHEQQQQQQQHDEQLRQQRNLPTQPPSAPAKPHTGTAPDEDWGDGVRLTLVSRGHFTPYSGMLPGWAAGYYSFEQCHIDLQLLAAHAGARLVTAEATGLDVQGRHVLFNDGRPPLPYDVLSIDVGITPGRGGVAGAEQHTMPVKPIDGFVRRYDRLVERYREAAAAAAAAAAGGTSATTAAGPGAPAVRVCVVGGGAGGVELAAAVRHRLEDERRKGGWLGVAGAGADVSLVCRGALLPGHPTHVRRLVGEQLAARRVVVRDGDEVTSVRPGELLLRSGAALPFDECLWCTEASPPAWLRETGLPTDERGFLAINEQLQSDGGPPEGPPLAANLRAFLRAEPLQPFVPQATALALLSLGALPASGGGSGDKYCVASQTGGGLPEDDASGKGSSRARSGPGPSTGEWTAGWLLNGFGGWGCAGHVAGRLLWRWKDQIDRAFMR
ncbi:hypothetical protein TSOC_007041, partial [Tetrabaena socialis]